MRPRCWALVTKRCSIKFASLGSIPGVRRAPLRKRRPKEAKAMLRTQSLPGWPRLAGRISRTSTCKPLLNEAVNFPGFALEEARRNQFGFEIEWRTAVHMELLTRKYRMKK